VTDGGWRRSTEPLDPFAIFEALARHQVRLQITEFRVSDRGQMALPALAAAEHLGADLCLAEGDHNPPLQAAAATRGVTVRLIQF